MPLHKFCWYVIISRWYKLPDKTVVYFRSFWVENLGCPSEWLTACSLLRTLRWGKCLVRWQSTGQKRTDSEELHNLKSAHCVLSFSHLEIYENGRCRAFDGDAVSSVAKLHVHSNSLGKKTEEIPKNFCVHFCLVKRRRVLQCAAHLTSAWRLVC